MTFYCVHIVTSVFKKIIINYNNNNLIKNMYDNEPKIIYIYRYAGRYKF